ncbi:MAG: TetR-like C-terminal domain-containing protein [Devosia sp.]
MPTPPKTSREQLIGIALSIVEAEGAAALTIAAVAEQAGVKGPSLYKHFADRAALITAVEVAILHDLEAVLRRDTKGRSPKQRLRSIAAVYRNFARTSPHRYGLLYRPDAADDPDIEAACRFSASPLFEELEAAGVPARDILPLSRTLVGFLHGFVSMEIAKAFRLGGSIDEAFEASLDTLLARVR